MAPVRSDLCFYLLMRVRISVPVQFKKAVIARVYLLRFLGIAIQLAAPCATKFATSIDPDKKRMNYKPYYLRAYIPENNCLHFAQILQR
jgi:hypothetical protein